MSRPPNGTKPARGERVPIGETVPALRQMPAALRRHAGPIGRLACDVAYRALDGAVDVPLIFCSRYGEAARSVELLTQLAHDEVLSPTSFSLSVHNAAAGLFSIARRDSANSVAIAAGEASAALGVIEACGLLAEGAPRVAVVAVDWVLPEIYHAFEERERVPYAWAALMRRPMLAACRCDGSRRRARKKTGTGSGCRPRSKGSASCCAMTRISCTQTSISEIHLEPAWLAGSAATGGWSVPASVSSYSGSPDWCSDSSSSRSCAVAIPDAQRRRAMSRELLRWCFRCHIAVMRGVGIIRYSFRGLARPALFVVLDRVQPPVADRRGIADGLHPECGLCDRMRRCSTTSTRAVRCARRATYRISRQDCRWWMRASRRSTAEGISCSFRNRGGRRPGEPLQLTRGAAQVAVRGGRDLTPVVIHCTPPHLTRGAKWWRVPSRRAQYTINVHADIPVRPFIEQFGEPALSARALTDHLHDYFTKELLAHAVA